MKNKQIEIAIINFVYRIWSSKRYLRFLSRSEERIQSSVVSRLLLTFTTLIAPSQGNDLKGICHGRCL